MADLQCIKGLKELQEQLKLFPANVSKNVMRTAVRRGAEVLHEACRRMAPELQVDDRHQSPAIKGLLKSAVYHKLIAEFSNDLQQTYFVGVRRGKKSNNVKVKGGSVVNMNAYYWTWIEFGHFYVPPRANKKTISQRENRKQHLEAGTAVWIPARHFMRDAWNLSKEAVTDTVINYIEQRVPVEARKLGLGMKK